MYDKSPVIQVSGRSGECWRGWDAVCGQINHAVEQRRGNRDRFVVAVECYTGLHEAEVAGGLRRGLRKRSSSRPVKYSRPPSRSTSLWPPGSAETIPSSASIPH